jgi:PKD repeat protein
MRAQPSRHAFIPTLTLLALLTGCGGGGDSGGAPAPPAPPPPPPPPAVNQNPVAVFTAPATLVAGGTAAFNSSASSDPEGGALTFHWNFGDGTYGGLANIAHVYSDAGTFTVRLRVADPQGASSEITRQIIVSEPAAARTVTAQGVVTSAAGVAIADVTVRALGGTATAQSDAQGRLSLPVAVDRDVTLRFSKPGYADQVQVIKLPGTTGADAYFEVAMLPRAPAQTLADAAVGGTVSGAQGARLTLPANALVKADGSAVTGAVQVSITPVDINNDSLAAFPGRFAGVNGDGSHTPIVSYGTAEFVLTQAGEHLQLRPGARATLELPLYAAANLDGSALAPGGTLPLWSLDERSGLWTNEGTGTLVASTVAPAELVMRAEVGHLSWWNADMGFTPFRPRPRCINDVPGQYDSIFEQATICRMLAEMDKPIPAQGNSKGAAKASTTPDNASRQAAEPRYRFPSMRVTSESAMAGGSYIDVPPDFDLLLTGTALKGTWRGQVRTRGGIGESPELSVPLRPVAAGGHDEAIDLPFDQIRAAAPATTDRYRFQGTAGQGVSITVAQASSSLTGWVRLRNAAGEILITAPFGAQAAVVEFRLPANGEYSIEVEPLSNAPGAYQLATLQQAAVERVSSITLTDATDVGVARVAANTSGLTYALWPESRLTGVQLKASRFVSNTAGWSSPESVATITGYTTTAPVQTGLDSAGNVFAVWDMGAGPVIARRAASNNTWSTPQTLASSSCGGGVLHRLAVNAGGDAIVMWARPASAGFCARRFTASNQAWSDEHVIDVTEAHATLAVEIAANGEAAAAWSQGGVGIPVNVRLARFRAGAWEAPITLGAANAGSPGLSLTDAGLLVYWQNLSRTVEAVWQPAGGAWGSPQVLGTNSGGFYLPRLAKRSDTRLQIVWWADGVGLSSREFDSGTATWSAAQAILPARAGSAANVAVAGNAGGSVVMWWASKLTGTGSDFGFSINAGAGTWVTPSAVLSPRPLILSQAQTFPDSGSVTVDGAGIATIVWREHLPPGQSGVLLRAARVPLVP